MGAEAAVAKGTAVFKMDPRTTALLIIDMQNAFLAEGAAFEAPKGRDMIPNLERILLFARQHALPVVWVLADHSAPYAGVLLAKSPAVRVDRVCCVGEESFELYPNMPQPREREYRVVKHKYDSFFETDLNAILRNLGVGTVIITGVTTSVCCDSTARAAFHYDYNVAFMSDATADEFEHLHDATLELMDLLFGRVMTVDEAIAEMADAATADMG
jgi:nicotinamidase-related amidase